MSLFIAVCGAVAIALIVYLGAPLVRAPAVGGASKPWRFAAVAALGLSPVCAAFLYAGLGAPAALDPQTRIGTPPVPEAIANAAPEERAAMIEQMVSGLAERLAEDPDDLAGWRMLARSYAALGRHAEAADAWRNAIAGSEGAGDDWRGLAMALIAGRDPASAPAVKEAFEEVLQQAPDDALALYFLGHAARSADNGERAAALWTRLRAQTPDDAPLAAELDALLAEIAGDTPDSSPGNPPDSPPATSSDDP